MVFSSPVFLFGFLPIVIISYLLLSKWKYRNIVLLVASIVFYIMGEGELVLLMISSIIINFYFGKWIEKKQSKKALFFGVATNILLLLVNKYFNFFIDNINDVIISLGSTPLKAPKIRLPIGISFYTFQSISYLVDVYRKENKAQSNITDLALYVSLFPQLVAGPIVRYKDVAHQLIHRVTSAPQIYSGIKRFILGLGKKVIIANTFGAQADLIFETAIADQTSLVSWFGIFCYSVQIYFDFAGYSDMAIGLGRIFGFEFLENFNFPYISKSIQEFWRRWHISLSNWFKDYLYIPLGGNRNGKFLTYFNLFLVFLLTGFWHGAGWSFIFWGLFHGFFMIIEKLGFGKLLKKLWAPLQHAYVIIVVMIAWVFFKTDDFGYGVDYVTNMFGLFSHSNETYVISDYLNKEICLFIPLVLVSSSKLLDQFHFKVVRYFVKVSKYNIYEYTVLAGTFAIFFFSVIRISMGSYNPFIYFRF